MKKTNPWKLTVILLGLVLIFVLVKKFRSPRLEGNMPSAIVEIDTAEVTELIITPAKARTQPVRLTKAGGWKLMKGDQTLKLEQGAGYNSIRVLMGLKPERIVSKRREKWNEFNVGDSTGTRVQIMGGSSVLADLVIGRSGFTQAQPQSYGGGSAHTFVRLYDGEEVYAINGFLEAQFNKALDDWRDKSFTRLKKDSVTRISLRYPADSSFVIEKVGGMWTSAGTPVDSMEVKSFLAGLEYKNATMFASSAPVGNPSVTISVEQAGKALATIEAWPGESFWTVRTSEQPETFFSFDAVARKDVFVGRKRFGKP